MKKFLVASFLILLGCMAFAAQIYVGHYVDDAGDTIQAAISPYDGNLYAIVNNNYNIIFYNQTMVSTGIYWENTSFGNLIFSTDMMWLQVTEYQSGKIIIFRYAGTSIEEVD